ncbi:hypothetical protein [Spiroplasma tabanidicola]|uniref:Uncharacterized protein n=1 Tax=Spiroplasma tabanidicola TaxID=324079 RepID=A0A6I6CDW0_9MOLU|nr:hypothetical protein [Spiroplasma tabanidicola]QGS52312.1 hypothetical protein STABA_v1c09590 [Spiroplasma tabanidicola]
MSLIKKKNKKDKSEFSKHEEDRVPNHWSYNNDPLLNLDPVFVDSENAAPSINDIARNIEGENNVSYEETQEIANKLAEMRKNVGIKRETRKVEGPLGLIINRARDKSSQLQSEIIENDPIIAKLHKIEEMKRTGGVDENLYTDLSKSKTENYADRAKKYLDKNLKNNKVETELERKLRLSREAQEKREAMRSVGGSDETKVDMLQRFLNTDTSKYKTKKLKNSNLDYDDQYSLESLENEVKDKIFFLKEIKSESLEKETELSILELETKTFKNDQEREEYLIAKLKELNTYIDKLQKKIKTGKKKDVTLISD